MKAALRVILIPSFILTPFFILPCQGSFWREHAQGWHWYEDPTPEEPEVPGHKPGPKTLTAVARLKAIQESLEELKARAVLEPTAPNVKAYQEAQLKWVKQSQVFAEMWGSNLLNHPELDTLLENPVSQYGTAVAKRQTLDAQAAALQSISQRYALIFVFKGSCPRSQALARLVEHLRQEFNFVVIGASLDGQMLSPLKALKAPPAFVERVAGFTPPSLFLMDPQKQTLVAIGRGLPSLQDIQTAIIKQTQEKK